MINYNSNVLLSIIIVLVSILFASCKKENLLDEVVLIPQKKDWQNLEYVTVNNIRQVHCWSVQFDIVLHTDLMPDSIIQNFEDYRVVISRDGLEKIADSYKDQIMSVYCNEITIVEVFLYNSKTKNSTRSRYFSVRTSL
jgi:hypothetical protein